MRFILGLTGGIGSGKSAASQWFEQQGIEVIDADVVAREIVEPGQPALNQIQTVFGDWCLQEDGQLDRRALREYIFNNPEARKNLEAITHPFIRNEIIRQLNAANSPYAILVSPLLFETNQFRLTHHNLLIDTTPELQIQRAVARDNQKSEQIKKIIAAQMPREEKQRLANDIALNVGSLEQLYLQLQPLHQHYLSMANASSIENG